MNWLRDQGWFWALGLEEGEVFLCIWLGFWCLIRDKRQPIWKGWTVCPNLD